jgi:hypothetical protein
MRLILPMLVSMIVCTAAGAHLVAHPKNHTRAAIHASQITNLKHARYVCRHGANANKRWSCAAVKWLTREAAETAPAPRAPDVGYWASKQIAAAEVIARESGGDPWPNCPDPFDGSGAGWSSTLACENGGNWMDSPGYYRCGLQFDPSWERRFGPLCP